MDWFQSSSQLHTNMHIRKLPFSEEGHGEGRMMRRVLKQRWSDSNTLRIITSVHIIVVITQGHEHFHTDWSGTAKKITDLHVLVTGYPGSNPHSKKYTRNTCTKCNGFYNMTNVQGICLIYLRHKAIYSEKINKIATPLKMHIFLYLLSKNQEKISSHEIF